MKPRFRTSTAVDFGIDSALTEFRIDCITNGMETLVDGDVLARFGHALSDRTRAGLLLLLTEAPAHPADLADRLGVTRQNLSNHLACLRGCGLVVAVPEGRRVRYELADQQIGVAMTALRQAVVAVDQACEVDEKGCD
jgi:DNA-binding transcriptional ArsR family regulator